MQSGRSLVLNANWVAISTTPMLRALVLLCRGAARAIDPESYQVFDLPGWIERSVERYDDLPAERFVRTPTAPVEQPEVLVLRRFAGTPQREVAFSRKNLFRRDDHCCQYCGRRRPTSDLSIDHVVPRARGGETSWENCVLACVRCNTRKGDTPLHESGLVLRTKPTRPRWSPLSEVLPATRPSSWAPFLKQA